MKSYCLATSKSWHDQIFNRLSDRADEFWVRIKSREELTPEFLSSHKIDKVFLPHWSYIIPESVWSKYECIVFHMTDLPFGRGGSPLQNLIIRGYEETKISALRVNQGVDTGDVYLKSDLSLHGTAKEIFIRSSQIIESMIIEIIDKKIQPSPQSGKSFEFKRRNPLESDISHLKELKEMYDFIRMLDADGYPQAFIETNCFRFEFSRASIENFNEIQANVRIIKK